MAPSGKIQMAPMASTSDFASYAELFFQAFRTGLMGAMYPSHTGGFGGESRRAMVNSLREDVVASASSDLLSSASSLSSMPATTAAAATTRTHRLRLPQVQQSFLFKATDPSLLTSPAESTDPTALIDPFNGIVGTAKYTFYPSRSEDELIADMNDVCAAGFSPGSDPEFILAWREAVEQAKIDVLGGQAYLYLSVLITREGFQRRGIGRQLLDWGLKTADELGVPLYLEASPAGRPLYEKVGFVAHGRLPFNGSRWCDTDALEHLLMVRPARPRLHANGLNGHANGYGNGHVHGNSSL